MPNKLSEKEIQINGKVIGFNSIIKLNIKTAFWIISTIFSLVMFILTYSYFDLKSSIKNQQIEYTKSNFLASFLQ